MNLLLKEKNAHAAREQINQTAALELRSTRPRQRHRRSTFGTSVEDSMTTVRKEKRKHSSLPLKAEKAVACC